MDAEDRGACGIVCRLRKDGHPTHGTLKRTLEALVALGHRGGEIRGEGDGAGLLIDVPRGLWSSRLEAAGKGAELASSSAFFVGHLLIPRPLRGEAAALKARLRNAWASRGADILLEVHHPVHSEALGPRARAEEPEFWQVAGLDSLSAGEPQRDAALDVLAEDAEGLGAHVASLSSSVAVYKVHGAPALLPRYYPELQRPECRTLAAVGHSRYSTNTLATVLRAQPFGLVAHNGEINTIERLRREAVSLGLRVPPGGSDSQDLDRILRGLCVRYGLTLFEAAELLFPPVHHEILRSPEVLRSLYATMRRVFDASAQGPAALILWRGGEFVFSVDALGLRPLWLVDTAKELVATSEAGVVPVEALEGDPKPLAPGEKVAVELAAGGLRVYSHPSLQKEVLARFRRRVDLEASWRALGLVRGQVALPPRGEEGTWRGEPAADLEARRRRAGWTNHDVELLKGAIRQGMDPVGSLGWDGPLAALSRDPVNLADFLHEDAAVVTNPAIDPKREGEHFSTRVRLGRKVEPGAPAPHAPWVSLDTPLLLTGIAAEIGRRVAARRETALVDDVTSFLGGQPGRVCRLALAHEPGQRLGERLRELGAEAVEAVGAGAQVLVLVDGAATAGVPVDPLLAAAAVDRSLREERPGPGAPSLRRRASLIVASDLLRNLHDLCCVLGLGADAVAPALLWESAWAEGGEEAVARLLDVLAAGVRTVISTMGIHELTGYGRIFSAVGLHPDVAGRLGVDSRCGARGLTLDALDRGYAQRSAGSGGAVPRIARFNARVASSVRALAAGELASAEYARRLGECEATHPVALRHALDLVAPEAALTPEEVDASIGGHAYPLFLCPMSFGSQGETAFRIYAEVGRRLNVPCMNGEGGELPDLLGRFRGVRSQQVASGRFGVHPELLNSVDLLEIKIGQGAKPGEGGHLPGAKVTARVAEARNAAAGVALISPSNHHDIYSIEDLAELVEELRTVNPGARISVKIPVVSGVATIALGIAKAGADILCLSGYDGGTGAARLHAIRRVGLPVEIGISEAHRALSGAGLRGGVEIWADGGMRSGLDVVRCLCLGADRVGFGTWALLGIGCVLCRSCHLDVCPRGISTQLESADEARRRGLQAFEPRDFEAGVTGLARLLTALGEEARRLGAYLGVRRLRDLVGRVDLLSQAREHNRLDLAPLLTPASSPAPAAGGVTVRRPLSYLTRVSSHEVLAAAEAGALDVTYEDDRVRSSDRAMGTHLSGEAVRRRPPGASRSPWQARLHLGPGSVPGNGLGAFNAREVELRVEGGSQDGVAKGARGGRVVVLKGEKHDGKAVGGAVGKGFAYGAQEGLLIVQGDADSRCGVRLSGADVIVGGRLREPLLDALGFLADRANLKGFAFEYMTAGRAVVLGDPGPWLCSGMTGGVVYCRLDPDLGLTRDALRRRLSLGSAAEIQAVGERGVEDLTELLTAYVSELRRSPLAAAEGEARWVESLLPTVREAFVALRPRPSEPKSEPATIGD